MLVQPRIVFREPETICLSFAEQLCEISNTETGGSETERYVWRLRSWACSWMQSIDWSSARSSRALALHLRSLNTLAGTQTAPKRRRSGREVFHVGDGQDVVWQAHAPPLWGSQLRRSVPPSRS